MGQDPLWQARLVMLLLRRRTLHPDVQCRCSPRPEDGQLEDPYAVLGVKHRQQREIKLLIAS